MFVLKSDISKRALEKGQEGTKEGLGRKQENYRETFLAMEMTMIQDWKK